MGVTKPKAVCIRMLNNRRDLTRWNFVFFKCAFLPFGFEDTTLQETNQSKQVRKWESRHHDRDKDTTTAPLQQGHREERDRLAQSNRRSIGQNKVQKSRHDKENNPPNVLKEGRPTTPRKMKLEELLATMATTRPPLFPLYEPLSDAMGGRQF